MKTRIINGKLYFNAEAFNMKPMIIKCGITEEILPSVTLTAKYLKVDSAEIYKALKNGTKIKGYSVERWKNDSL